MPVGVRPMNIFEQIKVANENCESIGEYVSLWYRVFVALLICIPVLFLAGFVTGCIMFKNPVIAGAEVINAMF